MFAYVSIAMKLSQNLVTVNGIQHVMKTFLSKLHAYDEYFNFTYLHKTLLT